MRGKMGGSMCQSPILLNPRIQSYCQNPKHIIKIKNIYSVHICAYACVCLYIFNSSLAVSGERV